MNFELYLECILLWLKATILATQNVQVVFLENKRIPKENR